MLSQYIRFLIQLNITILELQAFEDLIDTTKHQIFILVHGVTQDNNLCLGNLKSAVDTDQLFPKCVLYDYKYIEQNFP